MNASNFYYPLSGLINAATSISLGIFVLNRNRSKITHIIYALFCLSIAVWSGFYFAWLMSDTAEAALFYSRCFMAGAIFIPIFYLHHILALLGLNKSKKHIIFLIYTAGIICSAFNFTSYYIPETSPQMSFKFWPKAGILFTVFLITWVLVVIYGVYEILKAYRGSNGQKRNMLKYVLIATLIGWGGGATNFPLWYGIRILPIGNILVSGYVIITAYAIVKHRLMQIEIVIKKTLIFSGILASIFAIFAGFTFFAHEFLIELLGANTRYVVLFFTVLFITLGIKPLENFLVNLTDNILFQRKYDYRKTLKEASEGMTLITDMKKLLNFIVRVVAMNIRVKSASLFSFDESKNKYILRVRRGSNRKHIGYSLSPNSDLVHWLKTNKEALLYFDIEDWMKSEKLLRKEKGLMNRLISIKEDFLSMDAILCVPSFIKGELIGFLMLGEKLSGDIYTQEDLHLLSTLASEAAIAVENARNFMEIEKLREKERESYIQTVLALAQTVDEKDSYTHGHLEDVAFYGMKVAEELEGSSEFAVKINMEELETALKLHDIGKIGVPDAILHKNGNLKPDEWVVMKQHCAIGARIVDPITKLRRVGYIIKHHQEKYDGTGYPDGLKGEEIPLESRIISVVDAYHAMISDRPYRKALPEEVALRELKSNIGTQFDPVVVGAFARAWEKGKIRKR